MAIGVHIEGTNSRLNSREARRTSIVLSSLHFAETARNNSGVEDRSTHQVAPGSQSSDPDDILEGKDVHAPKLR